MRRLSVGIALALASLGAVSGQAAIDPPSSGAIRLQQQAPEYLYAFNGASNFHLRFGLDTDETIALEGAHVDDVTVRCFGRTYGADAYRPLEGTSMATPHVTGAAALVWARNPAATTAAVRSALLTTVDPIPALSGKLVTGGRLNVGRAVQAAFAPPPPAPPPGPASSPS